jgi:hypothetical protein
MLKKKGIIAGNHNLGLGEVGYDMYFPGKKKLLKLFKYSLHYINNLQGKSGFSSLFHSQVRRLYKVKSLPNNLTNLCRVSESFQDKCNNSYVECVKVGEGRPSYLYKTIIGNTGLQPYNKEVKMLLGFSNQDAYEILSVFLSSPSGEKEISSPPTIQETSMKMK